MESILWTVNPLPNGRAANPLLHTAPLLTGASQSRGGLGRTTCGAGGRGWCRAEGWGATGPGVGRGGGAASYLCVLGAGPGRGG
jgi:hypothetical protein